MGVEPTGSNRPNARWLLQKLQSGEMTAEEFVKLSKEHGKELREQPMDTQKGREIQETWPRHRG